MARIGCISFDQWRSTIEKFGLEPSNEMADFRMQGRKAKQSGNLGYIYSMLTELRTMAMDEKCDVLAYFIEMAIIEAGDELAARESKKSGRQKRDSAA